MFLDAVIHGAAYTSYSVFYKDWAASKEETYWQFGVAALCIVGVMVFFLWQCSESFSMKPSYFSILCLAHCSFIRVGSTS